MFFNRDINITANKMKEITQKVQTKSKIKNKKFTKKLSSKYKNKILSEIYIASKQGNTYVNIYAPSIFCEYWTHDFLNELVLFLEDRGFEAVIEDQVVNCFISYYIHVSWE